MNIDFEKNIKCLNFEDMIWILFAFLCFINIYGNSLEKKHTINNDSIFQSKADDVFIITLTITFLFISIFLLEIIMHLKTLLKIKKSYMPLKS